jgi:hypothetical protein
VSRLPNSERPLLLGMTLPVAIFSNVCSDGPGDLIPSEPFEFVLEDISPYRRRCAGRSAYLVS